jgi:hypothetical protein
MCELAIKLDCDNVHLLRVNPSPPESDQIRYEELEREDASYNQKLGGTSAHLQGVGNLSSKASSVSLPTTDHPCVPAVQNHSPALSSRAISASDSAATRSISTSNCYSKLDQSQATSTSGLELPVEVSYEEQSSEVGMQTQHDEKSKPRSPSRGKSNSVTQNYRKEGQDESSSEKLEKDQNFNSKFQGAEQKNASQASEKVQRHQSRKKNNHKVKISEPAAGEILFKEKCSSLPKKLGGDKSHATSSTTSSDENGFIPPSLSKEQACQAHVPSSRVNDKANQKGKKKSVDITNHHGHFSKSSSLSASSSPSMQRVDSTSGDAEKEPTTPKKSVSTPSLVLDDPALWPALGPSNSPQSSIADGKRPPPISTSTTRHAPRRKPSSNQFIMPAVPKIQKPRPQS